MIFGTDTSHFDLASYNKGLEDGIAIVMKEVVKLQNDLQLLQIKIQVTNTLCDRLVEKVNEIRDGSGNGRSFPTKRVEEDREGTGKT